MKIRIILILLLFLPFALKGQVTLTGVDKTTEETFKTVFYNKGKVFVGVNQPASGDEQPAVYVHGSIKVADGSAIDQQGITTLTGDFINAQTGVIATNNNVFTYSNQSKKGIIRFQNPLSTVANNKLFQHPVGGNDPSSIGKGTMASYNFDLNYKQEIIFEGNADKRINYIDFPTIEVADKGYLALTSGASASAVKVNTKPGAVFSVEGRYTTTTNGIGGTTTNRAVEYGHILMDQEPVRDVSAVMPSNYETGYSYNMLDLQLYDYNNPVATNNAPTDGLTMLYAPVNLSGITSPFQSLANDYFYYHTLFSPSKLWDNGVEANVDPKGKIYPGEGYVVAMNLSDFDWDLIKDNWDVNKADRASGGFQFSTLFLDKKPGYITVNRNLGSTWSGRNQNEFSTHLSPEKFLDKTKAITVNVKSNAKQKFFLANPFMAPLDLGDIVSANGSTVFGLKAGPTFDDNEIRNKFWILSESSLDYNTASQKNFYKLHYYSNALLGGTAFLDQPSGTQFFIAPLQVFVLQTAKLAEAGNSKFTFDTSKLGHANVLATKNNVEIVDQLLIQVVNENNGAEDRHAIVFSNQAKAESGDLIDDIKDDLNYTFVTEVGNITEQRSGAVYTKSVNNKVMRTNAVPTDTKQLALYVSPTKVPQNMVLRPYRLESLYSVEGVWLEDKQLNTVTHLTPGMEYPFESTVDTDKNAQENRFILHFAKVDQDDWYKETESPITCHYNKPNLYIRGLNNDDINSSVEIFDLQGRLVGKTKINSIPMTHYLPLASGTYIVKITGKRNFTTKFLSTQN